MSLYVDTRTKDSLYLSGSSVSEIISNLLRNTCSKSECVFYKSDIPVNYC
jgi:hypothetical protein